MDFSIDIEWPTRLHQRKERGTADSRPQTDACTETAPAQRRRGTQRNSSSPRTLTFGCPNKASGLCRNFISQRTSRASWWPASGCGRSLISRTGRGGGHRPRLLLASLLWSSGLHLCDLHLWTASHERARSTLSSLGSSQARLIALLDGRYGCRRFQRRALIV